MSPPPDDTEDLAAILARRAAFVAAALTALGACDAPPTHAPVALEPVDAAPSRPEVVVRETASVPASDAGPLQVASTDAGPTRVGDEDRDAGRDGGHGKGPTLVKKKPPVAPSAEPRPCLSLSGAHLLTGPFDD